MLATLQSASAGAAQVREGRPGGGALRGPHLQALHTTPSLPDAAPHLGTGSLQVAQGRDPRTSGETRGLPLAGAAPAPRLPAWAAAGPLGTAPNSTAVPLAGFFSRSSAPCRPARPCAGLRIVARSAGAGTGPGGNVLDRVAPGKDVRKDSRRRRPPSYRGKCPRVLPAAASVCLWGCVVMDGCSMPLRRWSGGPPCERRCTTVAVAQPPIEQHVASPLLCLQCCCTTTATTGASTWCKC